MNKFIAQIFKSAGVAAKVSKDSKTPRFKVVDSNLTLEGVVRTNRYSMKITDRFGKTIDSLSVVISNSNDVVNRINESVNTFKSLSSIYEERSLKEEDDEFDTVDIANEEQEEELSLETGLSNLYNTIMDVAEQAENLTSCVEDSDAEGINRVISIASSLYDCAIDVDEFIEDITPEDEEVSESFKESYKKTNISKVIDNLNLVESLLIKNKDYKDILTAIKDIKSELIVRGK